jgi:hypothetical protein
MVNLAGFDVIGEVHIETVVDLLNLSPIADAKDGSNRYLLGGPFSTDLDVPLGSLGVVPLRVVLEATLQAVAHQSIARLSISLTGGSLGFQGLFLDHIGGTMTVTVPIGFAAPLGATAAPGAPPISQRPVFLLSAMSPECILDKQTRASADSRLGPGGADQLTEGLIVAVAALLALAGTLPIPIFGFKIVPGVDSDDPLQLSAAPIVAWIDSATLAVFGYYRARATGGDVTSKKTSDIGQVREEFFYTQAGVLPGHRVALLFSADAFHRGITCPTIRKSVVTFLVTRREANKWVALTRSVSGAAILRQVSQDNFYGHYIDEGTKNPSGDTKVWYEQAMVDVRADAEAAILLKAQKDEGDWLQGPDGQKAVTDAMPSPCGIGSVEMTRISPDVPIVQGDFVLMLDRMDAQLGQHRITMDFDAGGSLEISTGDLSASASGSLEVFVGVTYDGLIAVTYVADPLIPKVNGTGLDGEIIATVSTLMTLFFEGSWQSVMAYAGLVLRAQMTKALEAAFPQPQLLTVPTTSLAPFPSRMDDVQIDPQSVLAIGLICRQPRHNQFQPALLLDAAITDRVASTQPPLHGRIDLPATKWGCDAATFETTRTLWDTTVSVHWRLRDAPFPVTVNGWQMEIGNFSSNLLGASHVIDPRPTWSNEPHAIGEGAVTLSGQVNVPDPPVVVIQGPFVLGHLRRQDVTATVTGDQNRGWLLRLRGTDGNFFLHFMLDVTDGDGVRWHGETYIPVQSDQLDLPLGYWAYKADCDAKYQQWYRDWWISVGSKYASMANVQPGQPVMGDVAREEEAIRTLVAADDAAGMTRLINAVQQYGPSFLRQVSGVPVVRGAGSKR